MKNVLKFSAFGVLTLLVALVAFSCQKESQLMVEPQTSEAGTKSLIDCNEFDYYGELHNEGVAYVMSFKEEYDEVVVDELSAKYFIAQKTEEFLQTIELNGSTYPAGVIAWSSIFETDVSDYYGLLDASELNEDEQAILMDFFEQFQWYDFESASGVAAFIEMTQNLECDLTGSDLITNPEMVFEVFSVARHSAQYWASYK